MSCSVVVDDKEIVYHDYVNISVAVASPKVRMGAAPLVRANVKITYKNAVCEESSAPAYGIF